MIFYRIIRFDGDEFPTWKSTLAEAHVVAKARSSPETRIESFEVETDKDSIEHMLNGDDSSYFSSGPLRTWKLAPRGGLSEIPNGE